MAADLRHAFRRLARSPGFAAVAILTLGLGIGANTAIFSVVDAVLLRPLPYPRADQLVMVWEDSSFIGFPRNTPAPANWADWRARNDVFTDIAATRGRVFSLTGDGQPEVLPARGVTANFWTIMGAAPLLGRVFSATEDTDSSRLAVLSYGLWQRRFGGDRSILGRAIVLDGASYTVIGVMPRGFVYPNRQTELWVPAGFTPADLARRTSHFLQCVARLRPGVSLQQAQTAMSTVAAQLARQYPESNAQIGAVVVPLRDQIAGSLRTALLVLLGAAGCVLLIACANLASLLLARAAARRREIALRAALGAGRGRLLRQMAVESLLLASLGAAAGLGFARLGMLLLERFIPTGMADTRLALDPRVLGFTGVVAVATAFLFGLLPAFQATRIELNDALKQGDRASAGGRRSWFRDGLVAAEVALALVLLTGAGLLLRTLSHLRNLDYGLRPDHVLTLSTPLPRPAFNDPARREAFVNSVIEKVRVLPGVKAAAYTSSLPFTQRGNTNSFEVESRTHAASDQSQDALLRVVSFDFFPVMGATLREGRFWGPEDRAGNAPSVIINETFAKAYWPGASPLGRRIQCPTGSTEPWRTIVGVVADLRERGLGIDLKPAVYLPLPQAGDTWAWPQDLAVRTAVDPLSIAQPVRDAIWAVNRNQPIRALRTMDEVVDLELASRSQQMFVLEAFAAVALLLAAVGLYGVLSYAVAQRTREFGVRIALGARPADIAGLVLRRGLAVTAIGLALGLAGALTAGRLMASLLYGIAPTDPATLAAVSAVLAAVAFAACLLPARRALQVDPIVALRDE